MAIKMFPPGMNTLSHRSQHPSEILFFRVYDWQVTFERKAHKHCYSATLHLIYKEVTRWSLPESAFPQRPLRLCQVNHCNVSGIVLSLAANMFQKMACRGGMVPTLALQFCSSTICVVWQNPFFLSFFFSPFMKNILYSSTVWLQWTKKWRWNFTICKIHISQVDPVVPSLPKQWAFDRHTLGFPTYQSVLTTNELFFSCTEFSMEKA